MFQIRRIRAIAAISAWIPIIYGSTAFAQSFTTPVEQTVGGVIGQALSAEYRFQNANPEPIIIQNVALSGPHCHARFTQKPILPGRNGSIVISCTLNEPGYFYRSAQMTLLSGRPPKARTVTLSLRGELRARTAEDDCSTVRLDQPGGSMAQIIHDMPSVRQVTGSCSFQTAVQMYDAWRIRHENFSPAQYSSPVELDYRIQRKTGGLSLDGGFIHKNLKELLANGACPRSYFNSTDGTDADEIFYRDLAKDFAWESNASDALAFEHKLAKNTFLYRLNPSPNASILQQSIVRKNFISFIAETIPPTCRQDHRLYTYHPYRVLNHDYSKRIFGFKWHESNGVKKEINAELDQGLRDAMPVGISYCSSVLYAGKSFEEIVSGDDTGCGRHASTVIGRRKNPKTHACEFLVRNSWGSSSCYAKDWSCIARTSQVWVDADTLANSIFSVTRMAEPNR